MTNKYQQEYAKIHGIVKQKKTKPKKEFKILLDKNFPNDTEVHDVIVMGWDGVEWKIAGENFISKKPENRDFNLRRYEREYGEIYSKVKLKLKS